jgi:transposase-like protein
MSTMQVSATLMEAIKHFSDLAVCVDFMARIRWEDGPECPRCHSKRASFLTTRLMWKCLDCKKQYSVKVGSIFEDSPLGLDKWLCAMWMIANDKNGVSSYEIARGIGITQKSAWFMLHRIRDAMRTGTFAKLAGEVEVDETFIGGKARNMHAGRRAQKIKGRGPGDKAIAFGMVERGGEVRATAVDTRKRKDLEPIIKENIQAGSVFNGVIDDGMLKVTFQRRDLQRRARERQRPYQHDGELLEPFEARPSWDLYQRGAISPVSVSGRTEFPV